MNKFLKAAVFFLIAVLGGVFAEIVLFPYLMERPVVEKTEITIEENTALKNAIEKVEKSIVAIKSIVSGDIFYGSGVIITSDGLIVTLAELVPEGAETTFFLEGQETDFQVLKRDLNLNLALIKIGKENLQTVAFVDLQKLKLGERVFLIGAFFEGEEIKKEVNEGLVKYFDKDDVRTNIFERNSLSGTPLFNIAGELLGLNTIDFWGRVIAIPVDKVRTFAGF